MAAAPATALERRPYAPARHPGRRGRWSRDAVLDALRAWTAERGAPPRRQDWTGEHPELAGSAQRAWIREHPRWPSASCVARHLGSWTAALESAGLPARAPRHDGSPRERAEHARALVAAGLSVPRAAAVVGVSASTVYNYLHAGRCSRCGGPVIRPDAEHCGDCTRHEPTVRRTWTRDEVATALRDWRDEHGAAPTFHDWTPSREQPARWERESPRWPSASVVYHLYADRPDPWNAALVDAGLGARHRRWSDDEIRAALAGVWARTGRVPAEVDLREPDWRGPHLRTLRRRYGGLAAAWETLSPVPM